MFSQFPLASPLSFHGSRAQFYLLVLLQFSHAQFIKEDAQCVFFSFFLTFQLQLLIMKYMICSFHYIFLGHEPFFLLHLIIFLNDLPCRLIQHYLFPRLLYEEVLRLFILRYHKGLFQVFLFFLLVFFRIFCLHQYIFQYLFLLGAILFKYPYLQFFILSDQFMDLDKLVFMLVVILLRIIC